MSSVCLGGQGCTGMVELAAKEGWQLGFAALQRRGDGNCR